MLLVPYPHTPLILNLCSAKMISLPFSRGVLLHITVPPLLILIRGIFCAHSDRFFNNTFFHFSVSFPEYLMMIINHQSSIITEKELQFYSDGTILFIKSTKVSFEFLCSLYAVARIMPLSKSSR